jgi:hypothetical protein
LAPYRQTEIVSTPLHGTLKEGVYSQVFLGVVDARPAFGRDCTLVTVTRVDGTREWARLAHTPIVLPFKVAASTRLVTNAELDTARSIFGRLGKKFSGPVLTGSLLEPLRSSSKAVCFSPQIPCLRSFFSIAAFKIILSFISYSPLLYRINYIQVYLLKR